LPRLIAWYRIEKGRQSLARRPGRGFVESTQPEIVSWDIQAID
jgi:hypothetical protein